MSRPKIVIFTGSGISAESGIPTYRGTEGLWANYDRAYLASIRGWRDDPRLVLDFYNARRTSMSAAVPNEAHLAIAALEQSYNVVVITQNIDNLHEQAGSTNVLHLHGQIDWARGSDTSEYRQHIGAQPITFGRLCPEGTQLRPDVVWFGEMPKHFDEARLHFKTAAKVLVVGTSLAVQPAAGLLSKARGGADKRLIDTVWSKPPYGYRISVGLATVAVPRICNTWLDDAAANARQTAQDLP